MLAFIVVKRQPRANAEPRFRDRGVSFDEHLFVFQTTPETLDKDVVQETVLYRPC